MGQGVEKEFEAKQEEHLRCALWTYPFIPNEPFLERALLLPTTAVFAPLDTIRVLLEPKAVAYTLSMWVLKNLLRLAFI